MRRLQILYKSRYDRIVNRKLKSDTGCSDYFAVRTGAVSSMTGPSTLIEGS